MLPSTWPRTMHSRPCGLSLIWLPSRRNGGCPMPSDKELLNGDPADRGTLFFLLREIDYRTRRHIINAYADRDATIDAQRLSDAIDDHLEDLRTEAES